MAWQEPEAEMLRPCGLERSLWPGASLFPVAPLNRTRTHAHTHAHTHTHTHTHTRQGPSILEAVVLGRSRGQGVPSVSTFDLTCFLIRI